MGGVICRFHNFGILVVSCHKFQILGFQDFEISKFPEMWFVTKRVWHVLKHVFTPRTYMFRVHGGGRNICTRLPPPPTFWMSSGCHVHIFKNMSSVCKRKWQALTYMFAPRTYMFCIHRGGGGTYVHACLPPTFCMSSICHVHISRNVTSVTKRIWQASAYTFAPRTYMFCIHGGGRNMCARLPPPPTF